MCRAVQNRLPTFRLLDFLIGHGALGCQRSVFCLSQRGFDAYVYCIFALKDKLRDRDDTVAVLDKKFNDCGHRLGSVLRRVVEQNDTSGSHPARDALRDFGSVEVLPVEAVDTRPNCSKTTKLAAQRIVTNNCIYSSERLSRICKRAVYIIHRLTCIIKPYKIIFCKNKK